MFDPKITEGPWEFDAQFNDFVGEYSSCINDGHVLYADDEPLEFSNHEDKKAIAAVPELLEVYKAAKNYIGTDGLDRGLFFTKKLEDAVKALEDRHCEK